MKPTLSLVTTVTALSALTGSAAAQGSMFQTPGMPTTSGQTTRFDNTFNPAIGVVFDFFAGYTDSDDDEIKGFDISLRSAELSIAAWVDPTAWAFANVVFDGEETVLEEGAVHYSGFDGNETLRIGRFFIDFGKQMQAHEHALRTPERPAVLAAFLGDEVGGDGVQFDNWFTMGDDTIVRYSIGAFASLIAHDHDDEGGGPSAEGPLSPEADQLALTARLTGFTSLTDHQTLQLGTSLRSIPSFGFHDEANDIEVDGLDNNVYGVDLTWGWVDDTETQRFTLGGEFLINDGALSAETIEPVPSTFELAVLDDQAQGYYAFADYAWDNYNSAGVQFSNVETPAAGLPELNQLDVYFTHKLSEFQRLRLAVTQTELEGDNDVRLGIQYTAFLGPHAHGVNF